MDITQNLNLPPRSLLDTHRQDELDALFSSLEPVKAASLNGNYEGRLVGITGLSGLPRFAKWLTYGLLGTWLNPWRGKRFEASEGKNLWGIGTWVLGWGAYSVSENTDSNLISLDYGVNANPRLLRPILGEMRSFQDGMWLARMRYRTKSGVTTLAYFTLREQTK